jgi:hypothetical protein
MYFPKFSLANLRKFISQPNAEFVGLANSRLPEDYFPLVGCCYEITKSTLMALFQHKVNTEWGQRGEWTHDPLRIVPSTHGSTQLLSAISTAIQRAIGGRTMWDKTLYVSVCHSCGQLTLSFGQSIGTAHVCSTLMNDWRKADEQNNHCDGEISPYPPFRFFPKALTTGDLSHLATCIVCGEIHQNSNKSRIDGGKIYYGCLQSLKTVCLPLSSHPGLQINVNTPDREWNGDKIDIGFCRKAEERDGFEGAIIVARHAYARGMADPASPDGLHPCEMCGQICCDYLVCETRIMEAVWVHQEVQDTTEGAP